LRAAAWLLCLLALAAPLCRAADDRHSLWEIHGRHNTVYLLGSIHVLRPGDYPLAAPIMDAYARAGALLMEVDLDALDLGAVQKDMLKAAELPDGKTLAQVLGPPRYARVQALARVLNVDLAPFDRFAPWFVAEAISQQQLNQLGFQPESGVEMFFLRKARADGKKIGGLETAQDQIGLFETMSLDLQADYLVSSLEEGRELPKEVDQMVGAWQHGDTHWFTTEFAREFGDEPQLYESVLVARNRKWLPKIEALLGEDQNYLVIVGAGHLVGRGSVLELLRKDGIVSRQR
jgi:uncharacterized protein YbaP (TraB family)